MPAVYLPPWRIDVDARAGARAPVPLRALARLAARALTTCGAPAPASLALILSNDTELAGLNEMHMGHAGPTDVLSFPLLPIAAFPRHAGQDPTARKAESAGRFALPPGRRAHLGDIVISVERAAVQAPDSLEDELRQLVVHGVLHICGWDHAAPTERDAMRALESKVLAS